MRGFEAISLVNSIQYKKMFRFNFEVVLVFLFIANSAMANYEKVPKNKRIICGMMTKENEDSSWEFRPVTTESACSSPRSIVPCWWDSTTSTCYQKKGKASGGLRCNHCSKSLTGEVECISHERMESCDIALTSASELYGDINQQRCLSTGDGESRCYTSSMCEQLPTNNPDTKCCDTDFCNDVTLNAQAVKSDGGSQITVDILIFIVSILSALMMM